MVKVIKGILSRIKELGFEGVVAVWFGSSGDIIIGGKLG